MTRVLAILVLAFAASGCSFVFVTPAAPPSKRECTSSRLAPVLDTVFAGYEAVRTGYAIFRPNDVYEELGVPREADIAVGAGLTAVFALQAFVILGGVVRVIPLTGVTFPFISYGGSSIVANMVLLGLLLVISDRARRPPAAGRPRELEPLEVPR